MSGQDRNDEPQQSTATATKRNSLPPAPAAAPISAAPLEGVALFAGLDPEGLHELAAVARARSYRTGEVIFHRDDPGQVLYVIRRGQSQICINSPDGHEVVLAVFGPGDYFGELALLDGQPRSPAPSPFDPVEVSPCSAATSSTPSCTTRASPSR